MTDPLFVSLANRRLVSSVPLYYKLTKHCFFSKVFNEPQRHKEHKDFLLSGFFAFLSVLCVFVVEYFGCLPVADPPARAGRPATLRCDLSHKQHLSGL